MRQKIEKALRLLPPSPQEQWQKNGATYEPYLSNGSVSHVPIFNLELTRYQETNSDRFTDARGREIGTVYDGYAVVNHFTPHQTRVWRLDDDVVANPDICVDDRAALGTEINGYTMHRSRRFAVDKGLHVKQIGTEYSAAYPGQNRLSPRYAKRLVNIALDAGGMCISKTAMEEALVAHELDRLYLGDEIESVRIGDSQPAMTAAASIIYMDHLFNKKTAAVDTKAACCHESVPLQTAAQWLGKEVVGGLFVLGSMVIDGDTEGIEETLSKNPELWLGVLFGKIHALRNGEISENIAMLDRSLPGQVLRYTSDDLSTEAGQRQWDEFPNINQKDVLRAIHMHLLKRKGNVAQEDRVGRMSEMHLLRGDLRDMSEAEQAYVYGSNAPILGKSSKLSIAS